MAIDLASGAGLLDPDPGEGKKSSDTEPWEGAPLRFREDRKPLAVWTEKALFTIDQPWDGYAGYGRAGQRYAKTAHALAVGYDWIAPNRNRSIMALPRTVPMWTYPRCLPSTQDR